MKTHICPTCGCSLVRLGIYTRKYKHPIFTIPPSKERDSQHRPALRVSEIWQIPANAQNIATSHRAIQLNFSFHAIQSERRV